MSNPQTQTQTPAPNSFKLPLPDDKISVHSATAACIVLAMLKLKDLEFLPTTFTDVERANAQDAIKRYVATNGEAINIGTLEVAFGVVMSQSEMPAAFIDAYLTIIAHAILPAIAKETGVTITGLPSEAQTNEAFKFACLSLSIYRRFANSMGALLSKTTTEVEEIAGKWADYFRDSCANGEAELPDELKPLEG